MSNIHRVPGISSYFFRGYGSNWQVIDGRTGEIVGEYESHDKAFTAVLNFAKATVENGVIVDNG